MSVVTQVSVRTNISFLSASQPISKNKNPKLSRYGNVIINCTRGNNYDECFTKRNRFPVEEFDDLKKKFMESTSSDHPILNEPKIKKISKLILNIRANQNIYLSILTKKNNRIKKSKIFMFSDATKTAQKRVIIYVPVCRIGSGSFSEVWKAEKIVFSIDRDNGKKFRIKTAAFHKTPLPDSEELMKSCRKVRLLTSLEEKNCQGITKIDNWGRYQDRKKGIIEALFTKMYMTDVEKFDRYVFPTFKRIFKNTFPKIQMENTVKLASSIGTVLCELDRNNVMHRDLKKENIIVKYDKTNGAFTEIEVTDFDAACMTNDLYNRYNLVGTLGYLSPETLCWHADSYNTGNETSCKNLKTWYFERYTKAKIGPGIDIWGLGCILHSTFFGEHPQVVNTLHKLENKIGKLNECNNKKNSLKKKLFRLTFKLSKKINETTPEDETTPEMAEVYRVRKEIKQINKPKTKLTNKINKLLEKWKKRIELLDNQPNPRLVWEKQIENQPDQTNSPRARKNNPIPNDNPIPIDIQIKELIWKTLRPDPEQRIDAKQVVECVKAIKKELQNYKKETRLQKKISFRQDEGTINNNREENSAQNKENGLQKHKKETRLPKKISFQKDEGTINNNMEESSAQNKENGLQKYKKETRLLKKISFRKDEGIIKNNKEERSAQNNDNSGKSRVSFNEPGLEARKEKSHRRNVAFSDQGLQEKNNHEEIIIEDQTTEEMITPRVKRTALRKKLKKTKSNQQRNDNSPNLSHSKKKIDSQKDSLDQGRYLVRRQKHGKHMIKETEFQFTPGT